MLKLKLQNEVSTGDLKEIIHILDSYTPEENKISFHIEFESENITGEINGCCSRNQWSTVKEILMKEMTDMVLQAE